MKSEKELTRIASLQKAVKVLDFIATSPNGYGVKEIASETKLNTSTCYHILNTLVDENYLLKQTDGRYVLGVKIPQLNNTFMKSIKPEIILIEELNTLQKETGETVYLLGVKENHIVMQAIVEGVHAIRVNALYEGYSGNYHVRASTKAIIAYWDEHQMQKTFHNYNFIKLSVNSPSNMEELKEQLISIRENGYCLDDEETVVGVCFVAAPIFQSDGKPVGSYALSIPKDRYIERKEELIKVVVQAAERASIFMGYSRKLEKHLGRKRILS